MTEKISRRTILLRGLQIPAAGAFVSVLGGCGAGSERASSQAGATACADPGAMSDAEQSTRRSINYTEQSPNAQEICAGCAFFHPAAQGGECGTCDMFSGGVVNSHGHCDSWSAKS